MISEKVLKIATNSIKLWEQGKMLDDILDNLSENEKNLRKVVSSLLFSYFRNKLTVDYLISSLAKGKIKPALKNILTVSTTQILFQHGIPPEAVVDVAVNNTKQLFGKIMGGVVNAILRKIVNGNYKNIITNAPLEVQLNIPSFVLNRWKNFYSETEIKKLIHIIKQPAPFVFRLIDESLADHSLIQSQCKKIKIKGSECFHFYTCEFPNNILGTNWLETGKIYIQDPATATSVVRTGFSGIGNILDCCSAPGGKTIMLSELFPKSKIYAMDRSFQRQIKTFENITRISANNIDLIVGDIVKPPFKEKIFNMVFADVPCTNTGVIRRRPDVLWRLNQKHISEITELQKQILESASKLVDNKGVLIYSTCSVEKDENTNQIQDFLKKNRNFTLEEECQLLPTTEHDGTYVAVVRLSD